MLFHWYHHSYSSCSKAHSERRLLFQVVETVLRVLFDCVSRYASEDAFPRHWVDGFDLDGASIHYTGERECRRELRKEKISEHVLKVAEIGFCSAVAEVKSLRIIYT